MDVVSIHYPLVSVAVSLGFLVCVHPSVTSIGDRLLMTCSPQSAAHVKPLFNNLSVSYVHSVVTTIGLFACLILYPEAWADMSANLSTGNRWHLMALVLAFSNGYFMYDLVDMMRNKLLTQQSSLLLHHVVVIVCFSWALMLERFVPYLLCTLWVEAHSIFLHQRRILLLLGFEKPSLVYKVNSLFQFSTFLVFRGFVTLWVTFMVLCDRQSMGVIPHTVASAGMIVMNILNLQLFKSLVKSDFGFYLRASRKPSM